MKKHFNFLAVILGAAMILSGCAENAAEDSQAENSVSESISAEPTETEAPGSETTEITSPEAETALPPETSETKIPETEEPGSDASETESETETEAESIPSESSSGIDIDPDMSVEEMLELINANSKTVGNDTCGYITVYAGSEYNENENGSYTVTSETSVISVFRYDYDFQTDLDMTAYMICLSAAMNAEEKGYKTYAINEFIVDGMNGYLAVMLGEDEVPGFMMYAVVIDSAETLRGFSCECSEYTLENIVSQGWTFDTYRRSLTTE